MRPHALTSLLLGTVLRPHNRVNAQAHRAYATPVPASPRVGRASVVPSSCMGACSRQRRNSPAAIGQLPPRPKDFVERNFSGAARVAPAATAHRRDFARRAHDGPPGRGLARLAPLSVAAPSGAHLEHLVRCVIDTSSKSSIRATMTFFDSAGNILAILEAH